MSILENKILKTNIIGLISSIITLIGGFYLLWVGFITGKAEGVLIYIGGLFFSSIGMAGVYMCLNEIKKEYRLK